MVEAGRNSGQKLKGGYYRMKYEDMVSKAWYMIQELGITEDIAEYEKDSNLYLVADVSKVVRAYVEDLENNYQDEDEDLLGFFERHEIDYK
jgi:hypothetical protein